MFKRLLSSKRGSGGQGKAGGGDLKQHQRQQEETKEADSDDALRTPATAPLGEEDGVAYGGGGVPRGRSDGSTGSQQQYYDAEELYADNFKLKRERLKLLEEISAKRFKEAQLAAALEEASEERARLETQVMQVVDDLHAHEVALKRLAAEKAEAEELLQALADYHAAQEQQQQQQGGEQGQRWWRRWGFGAALTSLWGRRKGPGGPAVHGRLLYLALVAAAPGVALLLALLLAAAIVPPVDHRVLGGLGGALLSPYSSFWRTRASGLRHLAPGRGVLRQGEYLRGCSNGGGAAVAWWLAGACRDPHVLHLDGGTGSLVLYRGHGPSNHEGPVWTSGALSSYGFAGGGAGSGSSSSKERYTALVDARGVLKVVKSEGGGKGGKETVVFNRPVSRLPAALVGLGVVKGK